MIDPMPITLNHTIVPSKDKEGSAKFFARIFGVPYSGPVGHFAQVHVNPDLSFDWDNRDTFEGHHYAFLVTDQEFDEIFGRLKNEGVVYGSGPRSVEDMEINHLHTGRALLLDLADDPELRARAAGYEGLVDVLTTACPQHPELAGLLVRPDGFTAWASDTDGAEDDPSEALRLWFGAPLGA